MRLFGLITILFLFFGLTANAQKKIELKEGTASRMIGGIKNGEHITRFIKRETVQVTFIQSTTTIHCDSAWMYRDRNIVEAFGRVRIVEGDSITITAHHLEYDGNTKQARLRNNVVFTKLATAKLYTDFLDYDRMINLAKYYNGGRLVDSINTLVSRKGYYDANTNLASFKRDVKVTNPDYVMTSDSMQYDSRSKIIYFVTPTSVVDKDTNTFNYQAGTYNTLSRVFDSSKGSGRSQNYEVDGEKFDIDDINKIYRIRGNVVMKSLEENLTIYGQASDTYKNKNLAKIYNRAYIAKVTDDNDTIFIRADTLVSIDNEDPKKKRLLAYHNVRIFKKDLQGIADSLEYRSGDSTLYFYHKPILWTDGNQMTADSISMLIERNTISKIFMNVNSFVISQDSSKNFNQIKGRKMTATFRNSKLNRVFVNGNGESIYFALDEKTGLLTGMNNVTCSNIIIKFANGKASTISFIRQPDGDFIPPHELKDENKQLADFAWYADQRPTKEDVVNATGIVPGSKKETDAKKPSVQSAPAVKNATTAPAVAKPGQTKTPGRETETTIPAAKPPSPRNKKGGLELKKVE